MVDFFLNIFFLADLSTLSAISTGSVSVVPVGFQTTTSQNMSASDLQKQWWHLEEVLNDYKKHFYSVSDDLY